MELLLTGEIDIHHVYNGDETAVNQCYALERRLARKNEKSEVTKPDGDRKRMTYFVVTSLLGYITSGTCIMHADDAAYIQSLKFDNVPLPSTKVDSTHKPSASSKLTFKFPMSKAAVDMFNKVKDEINAKYGAIIPLLHSRLAQKGLDGYPKHVTYGRRSYLDELLLSVPPASSAPTSSSSSSSSSDVAWVSVKPSSWESITPPPLYKKSKKKTKKNAAQLQPPPNSRRAPAGRQSASTVSHGTSSQSALRRNPRRQAHEPCYTHSADDGESSCDSTDASSSDEADSPADSQRSRNSGVQRVAGTSGRGASRATVSTGLSRPSSGAGPKKAAKPKQQSTNKSASSVPCFSFDPLAIQHPNLCKAGCSNSPEAMAILKMDYSNYTDEDLEIELKKTRKRFILKFGQQISDAVRDHGHENLEADHFYLGRNKKAWMNGNFLSSLPRLIFPKMFKGDEKIGLPPLEKNKRALFIIDNCSSHKDNRFINECLALGIDILFLHPHTTAHTQPLDLTFNGPFKSHYYALCGIELLLDQAGVSMDESSIFHYLTHIARIRYATAMMNRKTVIKGFLASLFRSDIPPHRRKHDVDLTYDELKEGEFSLDRFIQRK
jgi:hypothetical protein